MPPKHPFTVIGNDADKLKDIYASAFKTKYKRGEKKREELPPEPPIKSLKQWFLPGTWMVDNVNFDGIWYVFFVEGNSRFLIVKPGNGALDTSQTNVDVSSGRVPGIKFAEIFRDFLRTERNTIVKIGGRRINVKARPVTMLIGDSEKAFWTKDMMDFYRDKGIRTRQLNCKRDGHNGLAVLNRVVRTIRDMNYNVGSVNFGPTQMQRLVEVYNHTFHDGLSDNYGENISPNDVHYNEGLELKIVRNFKTENYLRSQQPGFILDVGQKVYAVDVSDRGMGKRRSPYLPGSWTITKRFGSMYELENEEGAKIMRSRALVRLLA